MLYLTSKGVFKGGGGFSGFKPPPPPEIFSFFLKSEGKEIERKKGDVGGGGVTSMKHIFEVDIFSSGVEIFSAGVEKILEG